MVSMVLENNFDFYLRFAKPLVLNLTEPDDRVLAAAWIQKLRDTSVGDLRLRTDYLKLLLFVLQRNKLIGTFAENPNKYQQLDEFPEDKLKDVAKELLESEEEFRKKRGEEVSSSRGDFPPYTTEYSSDLLEYAAAQAIPNFGVHAYYAISNEPLPTWKRTEKAIFPRGAFSTTDQSIKPSNVSITASDPSVPSKKVKFKFEKKSKFYSPTRTYSKLSKIPKGAKSGDVPNRPNVQIEERLPPTWGSNLIGVSEPPVYEYHPPIMTPEEEEDLLLDIQPDLKSDPGDYNSPSISRPTRPSSVRHQSPTSHHPHREHYCPILPQEEADDMFFENEPSFMAEFYSPPPLSPHEYSCPMSTRSQSPTTPIGEQRNRRIYSHILPEGLDNDMFLEAEPSFMDQPSPPPLSPCDYGYQKDNIESDSPPLSPHEYSCPMSTRSQSPTTPIGEQRNRRIYSPILPEGLDNDMFLEEEPSFMDQPSPPPLSPCDYGYQIGNIENDPCTVIVVDEQNDQEEFDAIDEMLDRYENDEVKCRPPPPQCQRRYASQSQKSSSRIPLSSCGSKMPIYSRLPVAESTRLSYVGTKTSICPSRPPRAGSTKIPRPGTAPKQSTSQYPPPYSHEARDAFLVEVPPNFTNESNTQSGGPYHMNIEDLSLASLPYLTPPIRLVDNDPILLERLGLSSVDLEDYMNEQELSSAEEQPNVDENVDNALSAEDIEYSLPLAPLVAPSSPAAQDIIDTFNKYTRAKSPQADRVNFILPNYQRDELLRDEELEEYENLNVSERSPGATKQDITKQLHDAQSDLYQIKQTSPADAGIPVTTPRKSPSPRRPMSIRVQDDDERNVSFTIPLYQSPDNLQFESPPRDYYDSPGSPMSPNNIPDPYDLPKPIKFSQMKPFTYQSPYQRDKPVTMAVINQERPFSETYKEEDMPFLSQPEADQGKFRRRRRKIQILSSELDTEGESPVNAVDVVETEDTTGYRSIRQQFEERHEDVPPLECVYPEELIGTEMHFPEQRMYTELDTTPPKELPSPVRPLETIPGWISPPVPKMRQTRQPLLPGPAENIRVPRHLRDVLDEEMGPSTMTYSPPPLSQSEAKDFRSQLPQQPLYASPKPKKLSPQTLEKPFRIIEVTEDEILEDELEPDDMVYGSPRWSPRTPTRPQPSPESPITSPESPAALRIRLFQGDKPPYYSRPYMPIVTGKRKKIVQRHSKPPIVHTIREVADDYNEENVPFLSEVERTTPKWTKRKRRVKMTTTSLDNIGESPVKVPNVLEAEDPTGFRYIREQLEEKYSHLPQLGSAFPEELIGTEEQVPQQDQYTELDRPLPTDLPSPVRAKAVIPGWTTPPHLKTAPSKKRHPPLLPGRAENIRVPKEKRDILGQEYMPTDMAYSPPPLSQSEAKEFRSQLPQQPLHVSPKPKKSSPQTSEKPFRIIEMTEEEILEDELEPDDMVHGSPRWSPRTPTRPQPSPESPITSPESPVALRIRLFQADSPPYYSQPYTPIVIGKRKMRVHRHSNPPKVHTIRELTDDYNEENVPFLSQVEGATPKWTKRKRRVKKTTTSLDNIGESPVKVPNMLEAEDPTGFRYIREQLEEKYSHLPQPGSAFPEELIGTEEQVPQQDQYTELDRPLPTDLPSPVRAKAVIPGWTTPPHLKTAPSKKRHPPLLPGRAENIRVPKDKRDVLGQEYMPTDMAYSPPPLSQSEAKEFRSQLPQQPLHVSPKPKKSSPQTSEKPFRIIEMTEEEILEDELEPDDMIHGSPRWSPRTPTRPQRDVLGQEYMPTDMAYSPPPLTAEEAAVMKEALAPKLPKPVRTIYKAKESSPPLQIRPTTTTELVEDVILEEELEPEEMQYSSPIFKATPPRSRRTPESPISSPESPIDLRIRLFREDEPPYYSRPYMDVGVGTGKRVRVNRRSSQPKMHSLREVSDDYAEEHVPFLAQVEAAGKLPSKRRRQIRKPARMESLRENPMDVPGMFEIDDTTGFRKIREELEKRFEDLPQIPENYSDELLGVANVGRWHQQQTELDKELPQNLPPPMRPPTVIAGWKTPPHLKRTEKPPSPFKVKLKSELRDVLFQERPPQEMAYTSPPHFPISSPIRSPNRLPQVSKQVSPKPVPRLISAAPQRPPLTFEQLEARANEDLQLLDFEMLPEDYLEYESPSGPSSPPREPQQFFPRAPQRQKLSYADKYEAREATRKAFKQLMEEEDNVVVEPRPLIQQSATGPQQLDTSLEEFESHEKMLSVKSSKKPGPSKAVYDDEASQRQLLESMEKIDKQVEQLYKAPTLIDRVEELIIDVEDPHLPRLPPLMIPNLQEFSLPPWCDTLPDTPTTPDMIDDVDIPENIWNYRSPTTPPQSPIITYPPSIQSTQVERTPDHIIVQQPPRRNIFDQLDFEVDYLDDTDIPDEPLIGSPTSPPTPPPLEDFYRVHTPPPSPGLPENLAESLKEHRYTQHHYDRRRKLLSSKFVQIKSKRVPIQKPKQPTVHTIEESEEEQVLPLPGQAIVTEEIIEEFEPPVSRVYPQFSPRRLEFNSPPIAAKVTIPEKFEYVHRPWYKEDIRYTSPPKFYKSPDAKEDGPSRVTQDQNFPQPNYYYSPQREYVRTPTKERKSPNRTMTETVTVTEYEEPFEDSHLRHLDTTPIQSVNEDEEDDDIASFKWIG